MKKYSTDKLKLVIALDRKQWKENNVLMVSAIYQKRALPIFWCLLKKEGSSNLQEQQKVLRPVLRLLKKYELVVIGDREFHSIELAHWLLHQAVLGSIERWIGILLENQEGALPFWLAPIQVAVASISEKSADWAETVSAKLKRIGVRTELLKSDRTISKKIRELSAQKVPLIAVVGEREKANGTVNLRRLGIPSQEEISFAQLQEELSNIQGNL